MHAGDIEHSDALQRRAAEVQDDAVTLGEKTSQSFHVLEPFFYIHSYEVVEVLYERNALSLPERLSDSVRSKTVQCLCG